MKQYEIMNIYKIELAEQGAKELSGKVCEMIEEAGGKVTSANFWGKRKFAYEIKNQREGFYDVINFDMEPAKLKKFESKLKLINGVLRYLITAQS
ncbi:MAG: 30S ribosomal protein S6 [Patescibacteria group bacterium]|nr:MAG: 30S ribosomal protein S6 [Patescibacteria group bacterium]